MTNTLIKSITLIILGGVNGSESFLCSMCDTSVSSFRNFLVSDNFTGLFKQGFYGGCDMFGFFVPLGHDYCDTLIDEYTDKVAQPIS